MGNFRGISSLLLFALAMLIGVIGVALETPAAVLGYA